MPVTCQPAPSAISGIRRETGLPAMPDLALWQWLVLAFAAMLTGYSKTAVNGVGSIAVVLFAATLPARESTGTLLPLLISADLLAIWVYRRHADWHLIRR